MQSIAIIGIGRWGKNLIREFSKIANVAACHHSGGLANRKWLSKNYPEIKVAHSYTEILEDKAINAVVIATPIKTHFGLARKALEAGKHVFVEKPVTAKLSEAKKLFSLAKKKKVALFIGNILLYHQILKKIKLLTKNDPIEYIYFNRNKFGTFGEDIVWNEAPHDAALAVELMGRPQKIKMLFEKEILTRGDIICAKLIFSKARWCVIAINRVAKEKNRIITIKTAKKIYFWENDELNELNVNNKEFKLIYKADRQPLAMECEEFLNRINGARPKTNSKELNLDVMRILSKLAS